MRCVNQLLSSRDGAFASRHEPKAPAHGVAISRRRNIPLTMEPGGCFRGESGHNRYLPGFLLDEAR